MKNSVKKAKGRSELLTAGNIFTVCMFAAIAVIFILSLRNVKADSAEEERRIAEDSLRQAVVTCYSIEGYYPESLSYIIENYNVRIDESKFVVWYDVYASNLMPDIKVIEVGG